MQNSWDPSYDLSDVVPVTVILGNEPSISSNRPLDVNMWLGQCDMVRYLSTRSPTIVSSDIHGADKAGYLSLEKLDS